jgi:DNA-binding NarL/FixJ family response regulator
MPCILITEDNVSQQRMISAICQNVFIDPHIIVRDGAQDAIETYREYYSQSGQAPDLIIAELSPTDASDLVVTRVAHPTHPQVPIIVLSSLTDPEIIKHSLDLDAPIFRSKSDFRKHRDLAKRLRHFPPAELFSSETN